jgi:hypothetical protein
MLSIQQLVNSAQIKHDRAKKYYFIFQNTATFSASQVRDTFGQIITDNKVLRHFKTHRNNQTSIPCDILLPILKENNITIPEKLQETLNRLGITSKTELSDNEQIALLERQKQQEVEDEAHQLEALEADIVQQDIQNNIEFQRLELEVELELAKTKNENNKRNASEEVSANPNTSTQSLFNSTEFHFRDDNHEQKNTIREPENIAENNQNILDKADEFLSDPNKRLAENQEIENRKFLFESNSKSPLFSDDSPQLSKDIPSAPPKTQHKTAAANHSTNNEVSANPHTWSENANENTDNNSNEISEEENPLYVLQNEEQEALPPQKEVRQNIQALEQAQDEQNPQTPSFFQRFRSYITTNIPTLFTSKTPATNNIEEIELKDISSGNFTAHKEEDAYENDAQNNLAREELPNDAQNNPAREEPPQAVVDHANYEFQADLELDKFFPDNLENNLQNNVLNNFQNNEPNNEKVVEEPNEDLAQAGEQNHGFIDYDAERPLHVQNKEYGILPLPAQEVAANNGENNDLNQPADEANDIQLVEPHVRVVRGQANNAADQAPNNPAAERPAQPIDHVNDVIQNNFELKQVFEDNPENNPQNNLPNNFGIPAGIVQRRREEFEQRNQRRPVDNQPAFEPLDAQAKNLQPQEEAAAAEHLRQQEEQRQAEQQRLQQEEAQRQVEQQRLQQEEAQRQAEQQRLQQEEAQRQAQEAERLRQQEEQRQAQEAERRRQEEEAAAAAEAERRRQEAEAAAAAEAERRRLAEAEAAAAAAEAERRQQEVQRQREEAAEAERRRQAVAGDGQANQNLVANRENNNLVQGVGNLLEQQDNQAPIIQQQQRQAEAAAEAERLRQQEAQLQREEDAENEYLGVANLFEQQENQAPIVANPDQANQRLNENLDLQQPLRDQENEDPVLADDLGEPPPILIEDNQNNINYDEEPPPPLPDEDDGNMYLSELFDGYEKKSETVSDDYYDNNPPPPQSENSTSLTPSSSSNTEEVDLIASLKGYLTVNKTLNWKTDPADLNNADLSAVNCVHVFTEHKNNTPISQLDVYRTRISIPMKIQGKANTNVAENIRAAMAIFAHAGHKAIEIKGSMEEVKLATKIALEQNILPKGESEQTQEIIHRLLKEDKTLKEKYSALSSVPKKKSTEKKTLTPLYNFVGKESNTSPDLLQTAAKTITAQDHDVNNEVPTNDHVTQQIKR